MSALAELIALANEMLVETARPPHDEVWPTESADRVIRQLAQGVIDLSASMTNETPPAAKGATPEMVEAFFGKPYRKHIDDLYFQNGIRRSDIESRLADALAALPAPGEGEAETERMKTLAGVVAAVLGVRQYPSTSALDFDELLEIVRERLSTPSAGGLGTVKALREVAWLIERKFPVNSIVSPETRWYAENEDDGWHWWTTNPHEAKRFTSRSEAEAFPSYQMIASDPTISITEHIWINDGFSDTHGAALSSLDRTSLPPTEGLSEWAGWDQARAPWGETKHKDAVLEALFRGPWSVEDADALIGFIDRTWTRRPSPQVRP